MTAFYSNINLAFADRTFEMMFVFVISINFFLKSKGFNSFWLSYIRSLLNSLKFILKPMNAFLNTFIISHHLINTDFSFSYQNHFDIYATYLLSNSYIFKRFFTYLFLTENITLRYSTFLVNFAHTNSANFKSISLAHRFN